jgi:copper(I)-binding protein
MLYLDIESTEPVKLVGARSPVAKSAKLVVVDPPGSHSPQQVVREIAIPANQPKRLAYLGSHVRLVDIARDVVPGMRVPIELDFVDANGTRRTLATEADVRGVAVPPPATADAGTPPKQR